MKTFCSVTPTDSDISFLGSRIDKQWFMIRDTTLKTDRLLTIVPLVGSTAYGCDVSSADADSTRNALVDLFTALQHPYVFAYANVDRLR